MNKNTFILTNILIFSFLVLSPLAFSKAVKLGRLGEVNIGINAKDFKTRDESQKHERYECIRNKDCLTGYKCNSATTKCEDACLTTSYSNAQTCVLGSVSNCPRNTSCRCPSGQLADGNGNCSGAIACYNGSYNNAYKCLNGGSLDAYWLPCAAGEKCACPVVANGHGSCVACTSNAHCGAGLKCSGNTCIGVCSDITCPNAQACNGTTGECEACCTAPTNGTCSGCTPTCNGGYTMQSNGTCLAECIKRYVSGVMGLSCGTSRSGQACYTGGNGQNCYHSLCANPAVSCSSSSECNSQCVDYACRRSDRYCNETSGGVCGWYRYEFNTQCFNSRDECADFCTQTVMSNPEDWCSHMECGMEDPSDTSSCPGGYVDNTGTNYCNDNDCCI